MTREYWGSDRDKAAKGERGQVYKLAWDIGDKTESLTHQ